MLKKNISRNETLKFHNNNNHNNTSPIKNNKINYYYIFNPQFLGFNLDNFKKIALSKDSKTSHSKYKPSTYLNKVTPIKSDTQSFITKPLDSSLTTIKKQYLFNPNYYTISPNNYSANITLQSNSNSAKSSFVTEFNCDENVLPEHLKQRINDIISRKKDSTITSEFTPTSPDKEIQFTTNTNYDSIDNNNINNNSNSNNNNKLSKEKRKQILKDFIGDIKTKRKDESKIHKYIYDTHNNTKDEEVIIQDNNNNNTINDDNSNNNFINKSKYVKDKNPHANLYDDINMFNKSISCQRLNHMHKIYNIPLYESSTTKNTLNNILESNNTESNNNNEEGRIPLKNIFANTKQSIIKHKIKTLSKFSIFPDYKARKIDPELKKLYANNNLHIIGGIRGQLEENIQDNEKEQQQQQQPLSEEMIKRNEELKKELEEDIDVEDLL